MAQRAKPTPWSPGARSPLEPSSDDFPSLPAPVHRIPSFLANQHEIHLTDQPLHHFPDVHSYADAAAHPAAPSAPETPPRVPEAEFVDFPFLRDALTKEYVGQHSSKVMVVLRGVPGSGKSMVSRELERMYDNVRIASADDFWKRNEQGEYVFERERLGEAHEWCRERCEAFCQEEDVQVVVVDNTNIEFREFQPYLHLAHRYGFTSLLVEPRTPWRYDAATLVKKNIHNVDLETIRRRLDRLQHRFIFPMYYGWFLSPADSLDLQRWAVKLAQRIAGAEEGRRFVEGNPGCLMGQVAGMAEEALMEWGRGRDLFHVTACYTQYGKKPGVEKYATQDAVQKVLGKVYELELVGMLITPQTVSFRVALTDEQLKLWNQDEDTHPGLPVGSRAHITVQTAAGVGAYVAGLDMLQLRELVNNATSDTMFDVDAGLVIQYPGDFWYLDLDKSIVVRAMFAPFFCRDQERRSSAAPPGRSPEGRERRSPESSSRSSGERSDDTEP